MKKYGKDYRKNQQGYEYIGEWYQSSMKIEVLKNRAVRGFLCLAPMTLLFLAGLSFDNEGGRTFSVLLPYIGMCFPMAYSWMGFAALYGFCKKQSAGFVRTDGSGRSDGAVLVPKEHEGKMVRSEYEKSILRPWRCAWALDILCVIAFAAEGRLIIKEGNAVPARELLFLCIVAILLFCAGILVRQCNKIKKSFGTKSVKMDKEPANL